MLKLVWRLRAMLVGSSQRNVTSGSGQKQSSDIGTWVLSLMRRVFKQLDSDL